MPHSRSLNSFARKTAERIGAFLGDQRVGHHLEDRHEDEDRDDGDDEADRADDEDVAADSTAAGKPRGEQEQEGAGDQQRAVAHAELTVVERPEQRGQPLVAPAAQADAETLQQEVAEARQPR